MALAPSALAIEHDIDAACREHQLITLPYTDALMHLLTVVDLQGAAESSRLNVQQRSIRLTQTISALKYAVRWVAIYASPVDEPASNFAAETFDHASDLLLKAESYLMVEAAYSWAHREVLDLAHENGRLTMSFTSPNDNRYEAYDRLIKPSVSRRRTTAPPNFDDALLPEVGNCFDRNFVMGSIPTVRRVLAAAYRVTSEMSRSYYLLPRDWDLGDFTIADFEKVNNAIRAVVYGWLYATDLAHSVDDAYVKNMPFKLKRVELLSALKDVTGLPKRVVTDIVALLTYSREAARTSDPALQPLLAISNDEILLSSTLVLGGSAERNLIALLNTRPADRARYDRLKNQKEALMRARLEARRPSYCRSWHGRIKGRKDFPMWTTHYSTRRLTRYS